MFREWDRKLSIITGDGATTVISVKQGTISKVTDNWLVADS